MYVTCISAVYWRWSAPEAAATAAGGWRERVGTVRRSSVGADQAVLLEVLLEVLLKDLLESQPRCRPHTYSMPHSSQN